MEGPCYWCGEPGQQFFTSSKRFACRPDFKRCPGFRKQSVEIAKKLNYNSKSHTLQREIDAGKHTCKYCGEPAKYLVGGTTPSCKPMGRECPYFNDWFSNSRRQMYIDRPDLLEFQRKNVKEINRRPDVVDKKSARMLELHRGDCDECKTFQENYHAAQKKRRGQKYRPRKEKTDGSTTKD